MDVREKLVEMIVWIEDQMTRAYPYTTDQFRIETTVDHLIANGVTVQEWVSVDDRLPEEKVNCIVHYQHAYCDNDGYFAIEFCFYDGEKFRLDPAYKVTHWMPLPEPPKEV